MSRNPINVLVPSIALLIMFGVMSLLMIGCPKPPPKDVRPDPPRGRHTVMWELCGYVAEVDANEMSVDPKNGNITLRIVGVIYPPFMIQKIPIGSMMTISPPYMFMIRDVERTAEVPEGKG